MLTMLVVDDEYLVRLGIRETIEWSKYNIEIVGEGCDGEEGLQLALKYSPDIIITDIRMPFMDGMELMAKIRENGLESSIIVLSGYDEFEYAKEAMHNGAEAYLLKPLENDKLVETIQNAAKKIKEKKSTRNYYEKLKSELTSIKKQFLRDLLLGGITDKNEIREKIDFLNLSLEMDNNFVVVVRIYQYELIIQQLTQDDLKGLKEAVTHGIAQVLLIHDQYMGVMVESSPGEWVVIIHMLSIKEGIEEVIKDRCIDLTRRLREEFTYSVSIGISCICQDITNIRLAYKEACTVSENKLLPTCSSVTYANDLEVAGYRREIRDVIRYIKNNYYKEITVDMAGKELYISSSHLMHLLKDELGKTFNDCLTEYRTEMAKDLLKDSRYKIYEVCEKVGYSDVKYFSQVFKKVTGMSPSDYAKSI
jgi:Response regulator containing CheY-like receiver domain and AraC-type DNA-binding domain